MMAQVNYDFPLAGKVAVVTGGASGIGEAIVDAYAEKSATVVVLDLALYAAQRKVSDGSAAAAYRCDVTDEQSVIDVINAVHPEFGRIDVLVNSAGLAVVARAAYEGVIFGLYAGHRSLERVGVQLGGRVLAVSGGARSPAYTQLLADVVQAPVLLPDASEATARGAAVQAAAVASGQRVTAVRDAWAPATRTVAEPRSARKQAYREQAWTRYQAAAAVTELDSM
jgi:NAD(P)-dependent dehydrogenase (short-subunit alcohol dehydrogenase family)